jgi:peptidoglycan-associated lipoprotein
VNDPRSPAYFQQRVGDRVFFTVDSSSLSEQARETLVQQARWLNENRDYRIIIEGHADERGTREYNIALGARRANAVMEFLNAQGIAMNRMRTVSYGKERPVEACPEPRCWDQNRRAVTVISAGVGA